MIRYQPPSVRLFANRFEAVDNAFVFRASPRTPGVRVSIAERDRFVARFTRGSRVATWLTTLALVLSVVARVHPSAAMGGVPSQSATVSFAGVCCCACLASLFWLWNAPVRALRARASTAASRP